MQTRLRTEICHRLYREKGSQLHSYQQKPFALLVAVHLLSLPHRPHQHQTGENFSAGLDLSDTTNFDAIGKATKDVARRAFRFRKLALAMQVCVYPDIFANTYLCLLTLSIAFVCRCFPIHDVRECDSIARCVGENVTCICRL